MRMRGQCLRRALSVFLAAALAAPVSAWGWGDNGHIAVAKVADLNLSARAKLRISELLDPGQHIYDRPMAMWADVFKFTPPGEHTRPWHFVDIPLEADDYDPSRDCQNDDCVIFRIREQRGILADATKSKEERLQALKFLIHLVGDIHQPLHASNRDDNGGNKVPVHFLGRREGRLNLHHVWDDEILGENMQALDPEVYASGLNAHLTGSQKMTWGAETDVVKWAKESHQAAKDHAYPGIPPLSMIDAHHPFDLDQAYYDQARPIVDEQIAKGGIRLAKLLNDALAH